MKNFKQFAEMKYQSSRFFFKLTIFSSKKIISSNLFPKLRWYETPPFCDSFLIKINNKNKYQYNSIFLFFPEFFYLTELERSYEFQSHEFNSRWGFYSFYNSNNVYYILFGLIFQNFKIRKRVKVFCLSCPFIHVNFIDRCLIKP